MPDDERQAVGAIFAAVKEGEYAKFMGETFTREYAWYL